MLAPVVAEGHLRHLAVIGPAGGDQFRTFRRAPTSLLHVRVTGMDLIQPRPDQPVVVDRCRS
jgi:hypothetical protein